MNRVAPILLLCILYLVIQSCKPQSPQHNKVTYQDSVTIFNLRKKVNIVVHTDVKKSLEILQEIRTLSIKKAYPGELLNYYKGMASIYSNYLGDTITTQKYIDSAYLYTSKEELKYLKYKSDYINAAFQEYKKKYNKAITYYIRSLNEQPSPPDKQYLMLTYKGLSYMCTQLNKHKEAIKYINKAIGIYKNGKDTSEIISYSFILAYNLLTQKDTTLAYQYLYGAYNLARQVNFHHTLPQVCHNIALVKGYEKKYDSAFYYVSQAIHYSGKNQENVLQKQYSCLLKSFIFYQLRNMDSCTYYYDIVDSKLAEADNDYERLSSFYEVSHIVHKYRNNNTEAVKALEKKSELDLKHFEQTKDDQLQTYENELHDLKEAKFLNEKNAQIQLREYFMLLYVVVSILLAFVVYFAFKFFEKRKNNEILHLLHQQQMFEIETQKALTQTQINERNRIAQEMHDDLGSSLTSVSMAVEMFNQNPNNTKSIQTINQSIGNLHQQVNEIVWSLNMRNDKVQNLLAYIHRFARNFLEEAHISLHWEESDDFKNIPIEGIVRRTLYLSSKELLNNIVKHAQASNVWISVNLEGRVMQLTIKDDGQGFDVNQVVTEEGNGNGLKNLQQNIQIINGTIEWKNENGTIVVIQCNL